MILGMDTLTFIHVLLSLIGIFSGFVVLFGMFAARRLDSWTAIFLITTVATSVTGFFFPFHGVTPGIVIGVLSLLLLALAILARYPLHLAGGWRKMYVITAVFALYFNVFVLVVQAFEKAPALRAIAPHMSDPPFIVAQTVVMVLFIVWGIQAVRKFREQ